jgi:putative toxin-antitoxin system antitoxin component (TIGR02293 family)
VLAFEDPYPMALSHQPVGNQTADQLDRVARVTAAAEATFGSAEKAAAWLRRRTATLAGKRSLELLDTDAGAYEVMDLLCRIDHGLAA